MADWVRHGEPAWRDRANFIIDAVVEDPPDTYEQLWTRQVSETTFEICCIPFMLYGVSLGDVVSTTGDYVLDEVVASGGRSTFRIWFGESRHPRDEAAAEVAALGATMEWSSENLLALDVAAGPAVSAVTTYLARGEEQRRFLYEVGRIAR